MRLPGKTVEIEVPTSITCDICSGSGAKPGTSPTTCRTCGGAGRVRAAQGFFTLERTCPSCQGKGQVISDPCTGCGGSGRKTQERTLSVNIPAGIEDGTRIRLAGEGEAGVRGGPSGDLYIFLSIRPHDLFQRDGQTFIAAFRFPCRRQPSAVNSMCQRSTVQRAVLKCRKEHRPENSSAFEARACRSCGPASTVICTFRSPLKHRPI